MKLYKCEKCGNIAFKVVDAGVPLVCCGQKMTEMIANTSDGALEKHVPEISVLNGIATIKVGSTTHPMEEKHFIQFIAAQSDDIITIKYLKPGDEPVMTCEDKDGLVAYEMCNLHGFWKGEK